MESNQEDPVTLVQRLESEYVNGTVQQSKYVSYSMHEELSTIEAYLNSKHTTGEFDSQGREKPFFNIVLSAANIWMRATDIDRKHIRLSARNRKQWLNSFFASALLQDWMRRQKFGQFLNEWGRTLARYGSAMIKFVKKDGVLSVFVIPWNTLIVDPVNASPNPKIEVLELSEGELRDRIETHGYDKDEVYALMTAKKSRENLDGTTKDNRPDFYKLYELHAKLPKSLRTEKDTDANIYEHQMWVLSYVRGKKDDKVEKFYLFKGKEERDPYMLTHLIKEDGRSLAMGAVKYLFEAQWMQNHSVKAIKDQLDIASRNIYQTADPNLVGRNLLQNLENGDVVVHAPNMPLSQVQNNVFDSAQWQNFAIAWREVGREATNISEAMLGANANANTAWRQTEAILNESYSLFELMTENKGLYLEEMLREWILPSLFENYDNADEISAQLEKHDITRLDAMFVKNEAIRKTNNDILDAALRGEVVTPEQQAQMMAGNEQALTEGLNQMGSQRFLKPSEVSWKKQFEGIEWDIDTDITGEERSTQDVFTTLNSALKIVTTPGYDQNPKAQAIVGRILDMTGAMSAIEYNSLPSPSLSPQGPSGAVSGAGGGGVGEGFKPPAQERNINSNKK